MTEKDLQAIRERQQNRDTVKTQGFSNPAWDVREMHADIYDLLAEVDRLRDKLAGRRARLFRELGELWNIDAIERELDEAQQYADADLRNGGYGETSLETLHLALDLLGEVHRLNALKATVRRCANCRREVLAGRAFEEEPEEPTE